MQASSLEFFKALSESFGPSGFNAIGGWFDQVLLSQRVLVQRTWA